MGANRVALAKEQRDARNQNLIWRQRSRVMTRTIMRRVKMTHLLSKSRRREARIINGRVTKTHQMSEGLNLT